MRILLLLTLAISLSASIPGAITSVNANTVTPVTTATRSRKKMKSFRSERELERYFREVAEKKRRARRQRTADNLATVDASVSIVTTSEETVTNTQHAGVDEGGIVKVHGDHLVILRRGRLFTIEIGNGLLRPVSNIDAFGPEMDPSQAWYDEMLISGDTIVVIGYSYQRSGTEIGLFNIDAAGRLSYRSTYHLRSNDYYSSRNYASRLIGTKLIFYTPLYFDTYKDDPFASFPAVRKWHKGATADEYRRIVSAKRVYLPEADLTIEESLTLHTVTICDLANGGFNCEATTVVGPYGRVFYVSPDSVYIWSTSHSGALAHPRSILYRMPLEGAGPTALRVSGGPTDQFSFLQSEDQHLNVLVRAEAKGDGMWMAEVSEGDVALLRVPLWSFSDGSEEAPATSYQRLPKPYGYGFRNRFVHNHVLYGTGAGWYSRDISDEQKRVYIVDWKGGNWDQLDLPHTVDRLEQMGPDAVVIGTDGTDLHFSAIRLAQQPEIVARFTRKHASEGETRSHGFFYKPDGDQSGTLGLPIRVPERPGHRHYLFDSSSAVLFLRNESRQFREVGELEAESNLAVDDNCRASCVDWYGNSRPLFLRNRVFALLGYELVEGKLDNGRMREVQRVNYAPR